MQLGGGCASGTLYTAGGGNSRMPVTLAFFIIGSAIGAWHLPWWSATPNIGSISLIKSFGWLPALALSLVGFAAITVLTIVIERRLHGELRSGVVTDRRGWRRFLHGPWPLLAGAVALALGNFATLYLAGRPWGITSAFALWGSKIFAAAGGRRFLGLLAARGARQSAAGKRLRRPSPRSWISASCWARSWVPASPENSIPAGGCCCVR
jgi:uncharacterized protein